MNTKYNLKNINTPAFVCDIASLTKTLEFHKSLAQESGCKFLFSLKTFSVVEVLKHIQKYADGFSASSLFETKLAKELLDNNQSIHVVTPGLRKDEIKEISENTDYIAFNSISQYETLKNNLDKNVQIGFRLNPQISSNIDNRYNPCCKNSKLGISIKDFVKYTKENNCDFVTGLHFHTNCDSTDLNFLVKTFDVIETHLQDFLYKTKWINLGGGYLFENNEQIRVFHSLIQKIKNKYNLEVYIEPGTSVIKNSFSLFTTVLDVVVSEGKNIAILDTTVNHLPEVLEFGCRLKVENSTESGACEYILAGSSCLAGDLFGVYKFDKPLKIGDKIIFNNVGAYSIVKANMFNGINLPAIYEKYENYDLKLIKEYLYDDFIKKFR